MNNFKRIFQFVAIAWVPGLFLVLALVTDSRVELLPKRASAGQMTAGDSTFAASGSFMIYPFFCVNGGHIHAPQWVANDGNNLQHAVRGYIYTSSAALRLNVYSNTIDANAVRDTSGFTLPAGGTFTALPDCDSVRVVVTAATTVTWGLFK